MERLIVKNFAGIKEAELEFRDITVLIGPQAEGKSVIAKLMYVMREGRKWVERNEISKEIYKRVRVNPELSTAVGMHIKSDMQINNIIRDLLIEAMDSSAWNTIPGAQLVSILDYVAIQGTTEIKIDAMRRKIGGVSITLSDEFRRNTADNPLISAFTTIFMHIIPKSAKIPKSEYAKLVKFFIDRLFEDIIKFFHIFIPANRSIYALIQRMPELWVGALTDSMFIHFGTYYEQVKRWWFNEGMHNETLRSLMEGFVGGELVETALGEAIKHPDGRVVDMVMVSSGQKEILPLVLTLLWLIEKKDEIYNVVLYIEEPEAHLFPETQKKLVNLIAEVYNALKGRLRLVITTHSPYILTALNNLLYAGYIRDKFKDRKDVAAKLEKVLRRQENIPSLGSRIISPSKVAVYEVKRSGTRSILDENGLISDSYMDEIADELHREEEELYEIKWEVERGSERYLEQ